MERPLSILMLCPQYHPMVGGYERAAERLSRELAGRGHSVTVVAERRRPRWPRREVRDGVNVQRFWCAFRAGVHMPTSLLSLAWTLLTTGRRHQVWHAHVFGAHALLMIALARLTGRASVLKLQSAGRGGVLAAVTAPGRAWQRSLLTRASALVTLTQETTAEAEAVGVDRSRIHQLGNGVDMAQFRAAASRAQAKAVLAVGSAPFVLYVGRLSPEKNPDGLIAAWRAACDTLPPDWRLVLVGDGPLRDALADRIQAEGLADRVLLAGQRSDVQLWMAAADAYVLPSHFEGLSNTLLEAMASGLPVVATRVSGVGELVEANGAGLVVDVGDVTALSDALIQLAGDAGLRDRLGQAGRAAVEAGYSLQAVARRHEAMYRDLVQGARA